MWGLFKKGKIFPIENKRPQNDEKEKLKTRKTWGQRRELQNSGKRTDQRKRQTKMYQIIIPEKKDSEFSRLYPKPQKMPPSKEGTRDRCSSN